MTLSQKFFNRKQAQWKVNHCRKKKRKGEKRKAKKIPNIEKPKDVGHFLFQKLSQNFDFCACPSHNALKSDAGGKKSKLLCCRRIFEVIWPRSSLKITKMSKNRTSCKKFLESTVFDTNACPLARGK